MRLCVSGGWSRRWNSLLPDVTSTPTLTVFSEPPQNISFPDHFLPVFGLVLYIVYISGLAVSHLSHSK